MTDVLRERSLEILDSTGDTKVIWDADNADEVAAAKAQFDALKKKGFAAFKVKGVTGAKGAKIDEFDPDAEKMILVPPMAGG
jgi:hypothetical protein